MGTGCCHGDLLAALPRRRSSQVPSWPSRSGTGGQSSRSSQNSLQKRVAACGNRKFQKRECSLPASCLRQVLALDLPREACWLPTSPSDLCFCLSISWLSFLSDAESLPMGLHDDQPSLWSPWRQALKVVLIYWEFQRISHTS